MKRSHCGVETTEVLCDPYTTFFFSQDDLVAYMLSLVEYELTWFRLRCVSKSFNLIISRLIEANVRFITEEEKNGVLIPEMFSVPDVLTDQPSRFFRFLDAYIRVPYRLRQGRVCLTDLITPNAHDMFTVIGRALIDYSFVRANPWHDIGYISIYIPVVTWVKEMGHTPVSSESNWLRIVRGVLHAYDQANKRTVIIVLQSWSDASEESVHRLCQFMETGVLQPIEDKNDDDPSPNLPFVLPLLMNVIFISVATKPNRFYTDYRESSSSM